MPIESCTQSLCDLALRFGEDSDEAGMVSVEKAVEMCGGGAGGEGEAVGMWGARGTGSWGFGEDSDEAGMVRVEGQWRCGERGEGQAAGDLGGPGGRP